MIAKTYSTKDQMSQKRIQREIIDKFCHEFFPATLPAKIKEVHGVLFRRYDDERWKVVEFTNVWTFADAIIDELLPNVEVHSSQLNELSRELVRCEILRTISQKSPSDGYEIIRGLVDARILQFVD